MPGNVLIILLLCLISAILHASGSEQNIFKRATGSKMMGQHPSLRSAPVSNGQALQDRNKIEFKESKSSASRSARFDYKSALVNGMQNVKDEILDCADLLVHAASNEERIEAAIDIVTRHRSTLALVGGGLLLKNAFTDIR